MALLLVVGAVLLSRARHQALSLAAAWSGVVLSVAATGPFASSADQPGGRLLGAGGAALAAALVCLAGVGHGRALLVPPAAVGAVLLSLGLLLGQVGLDPALVVVVALVLLVMSGSVFPWLALTLADAAGPAGPRHALPDPMLDPAQVAVRARLAHEILVAISGTVGLLVVVAAPFAVSLGLSGTLIALASCLVVALRTRQHRSRTEVVVGVTAALAGACCVAVSALVMHPGWRPFLGLAAVTGAACALLSLAPALRAPSVRRSWAGDLLETLALLCLPPLLVVVSGLLPAVGGRAPW